MNATCLRCDKGSVCSVGSAVVWERETRDLREEDGQRHARMDVTRFTRTMEEAASGLVEEMR